MGAPMSPQHSFSLSIQRWPSPAHKELKEKYPRERNEYADAGQVHGHVSQRAIVNYLFTAINRSLPPQHCFAQDIAVNIADFVGLGIRSLP